MRKVIGFQEYSPQVLQGIGWKIPVLRIALLLSVVVLPVAAMALSMAFRVLPLHGFVIGASLAGYLPMLLFKKPSVTVDSDFKVTFKNRPQVNRQLLHASLLSVLFFTIQAFLWAIAIADKLQR